MRHSIRIGRDSAKQTTKELAMAHQYAALLARQHRLAFKAFRSEREAIEWLLGPQS